jgi:hypothetical protein
MVIAETDAREQIERVLESELFRASELQRRMLRYLAEKSLSGEADQLKEYTIGVEGLGKAESYDPRHDSSVRLQAGKLRQKILEYYLTQGQADPVHIDFPRGRFKLVFTPREPSETSAGRLVLKWRRIAVVSASALAIAVCLCVYWGTSLVRLRHAAGPVEALWQPALTEFWSPFLDAAKPTLVCVGAPMFLKSGPNSVFLRYPDVNTWDEAVNSGLVDQLKRTFPGRTLQEWYVFTGLGEAGGAFLISRLLATRNLKLNFSNSTVLTWNDIGANNLIFAGPPKFNLQLRDLPVEQDLVIDNREGIQNLRLRPGEPASFGEGIMDPQHHSGQTYALISRLPGLNGEGTILILAGSATAGTYGAAQYVTSEVYVRELLRRIRLPDGKIPPYFQAVISVKYKNWTPVELSCAVHRVLKAQQPR